jgi:L,D-transpeptidase catalytic domain
MFRQPLVIFVITFFIANYANIGEPVARQPLKIYNSNFNYPDNYLKIRDTLYTFESHFIVVNLSTQSGYLYSKDKPVIEFGVSTGNAKLDKAVPTSEGLFVIQSKMKKWYSTQFDSTLMLNWMGFNYGIGFHALKGNGYYKYLGVKESSHGCVRISREKAEEFFSQVSIGTPVLVHNGEAAITISFADSSKHYEEYSYSGLKESINNTLSNLYEGEYFLKRSPDLVIGKSNVRHDGIPIGNSALIPEKQLFVKTNIDYSNSALTDNLTTRRNNDITASKDLAYLILN